MTEPSSFILFFNNWGQLIGSCVAIAAAVVGLLSAYASSQMNKISEEKLFRATTIIQRLEKQVGTVIGDEWAPLSATQIETLRAEIVLWRKPTQGIAIMYENEFGKPLAESLKLAFQAAGWATKLSSGSGFGRGIEVGWGADGINLKRAMETATGSKDVRIVDPTAEERPLTIIGVGAMVEEKSAPPH